MCVRMKHSNVLRGAVGGLVATIPMTLTMQALRAWLPREQARPLPPREVIDHTVEKSGAGRAVDEDGRNAITAVGHFAFGAAAGALFGMIESPKSTRSAIFAGAAYGLTVWGLAYGVGLPSLGLHPAAADDTTDRNELLIASHIVWGAALGLGRELARERAPGSTRRSAARAWG
jgi:uncharacterized membrane protein YagU involved in acid resistance